MDAATETLTNTTTTTARATLMTTTTTMLTTTTTAAAAAPTSPLADNHIGDSSGSGGGDENKLCANVSNLSNQTFMQIVNWLKNEQRVVSSSSSAAAATNTSANEGSVEAVPRQASSLTNACNASVFQLFQSMSAHIAKLQVSYAALS